MLLKSIAAALAAFAALMVQPDRAFAADQVAISHQVYVVRHLQKAAGDDPPLSAEGAANAQRLAELLSRSNIRGLFATDTRRARETAEPLARHLGLPIRTYDPRNPQALVDAAALVPGPVLIVGHSNTVPDLIRRFGGNGPASLTESDYGTVWLIAPAGQRTTALQLPASSALTCAEVQR